MVAGGAFLLFGGASGVAAILVGKDRFLGPSEASVNGLECQTAQKVDIKKNGTFWVRKFIRTEGGDGVERAKTALRVAKAVYDREKPDLVQISVLDTDGPQMRSEMRGRAIAAQAVFIPDTSKLPQDAHPQEYSVFYYDGDASGDGLFYGMRIDVTVEDAEGMMAGLTRFADCADPASETPAGGRGETAKSTGHEAAAPSHDAPGATKEDHPPVTEPAHPESTSGHPPENNSAQDEQLLTSTPESESQSFFSLGYLKSLIFGKGSTTAIAAQPEAAAGKTEPVTEDAPPPESHGEPPVAAGH
nr:hypothetical protein [Agrobacterium larrymoorei]